MLLATLVGGVAAGVLAEDLQDKEFCVKEEVVSKGENRESHFVT
jgi:hypothetical protein